MSAKSATRWIGILFAGAVCALSACAVTEATHTATSVRDQVLAAERAFAATMARRDFEAFAQYIDTEAVFFSGPEPRRGRQQVLDWWSRYFTSQDAPFSWEPDSVEVLPSGQLALSSGPVYDPTGKPVARFNSIWRQNAPGHWQVIFDKGSPLEPQD